MAAKKERTANTIPVDNMKEVVKMATKVNFSAVATSMGKPAGDYETTFAGFRLNPASASSGNPTVSLEWTVDETNNQKIFRTYSLQPQALWSLKRDLIRMGASLEEMNDPDADLEDILNALVGARNTIIMGEPREYEKDGEKRMGDNMKEVKDPNKL